MQVPRRVQVRVKSTKVCGVVIKSYGLPGRVATIISNYGTNTLEHTINKSQKLAFLLCKLMSKGLLSYNTEARMISYTFRCPSWEAVDNCVG